MTKDELLTNKENKSEIIESSIEMIEANSPIEIYKGEYLISNGSHKIKLNGNIYFDWFPNCGTYFYGKPVIDSIGLFSITEENKQFSIIINDLEFGKGFITNTDFVSTNGTSIKGILTEPAVFGDKSIPVDKLVPVKK